MSYNVWLHRETVFTAEGSGARPSIYPATIVQARYNGSYERAPWLCFPVRAQQLAVPPWRDWHGSETECERFWQKTRDRGWLIGLGGNPTAAYDNLIDQACSRVGLDRATLTEEPA
jgi:hypothetical protein